MIPLKGKHLLTFSQASWLVSLKRILSLQWAPDNSVVMGGKGRRGWVEVGKGAGSEKGTSVIMLTTKTKLNTHIYQLKLLICMNVEFLKTANQTRYRNGC